MNVRQLRAFVTVAEVGSISKAAVQLGYSQSALTHQVQTLERLLGNALFSRGPQGIALTAQGARLLPYARMATLLVDEMIDSTVIPSAREHPRDD